MVSAEADERKDMATVVHSIRPRFMERGELSKDELNELAEYTARQLLGVSAADAFAMLDKGGLDGKAVESPLRALRRLLNGSKR